MDIVLDANTILGQDTLRRVEALCVQEEAPACTAACPLHVDVRQLTHLVQAGSLAEAWALYAKAVPFGRLVARLCTAPCQPVCKRAQLGGAVQVQALEAAVATAVGKVPKPPLMLPKKDKTAAVVGGGLRGMAAANDLARKGYKVTLYEKTAQLGGRLRTLPPGALPEGLLDEEIAALLALPIVVKYDTAIPLESPAAAWAALPGFDAVFAACCSPLDALADGQTLLVAGESALVAGRRAGRMDEGPSPVYDVFDGRSAATTLDRLFQNVSVEAGREKEGSAPTLLYTNLAGIAPVPPVAPGPGGYTQQQASEEAARCIQCQCLECVKKCGFMQEYKTYPRRYVREVYNNLSIAMGTHHANGMINTCALCGQCEAVCPNGLDMAEVFLAARQRMVQTEKMPPSAHEFAMLDMEYSMSDAFWLARHAPGTKASRWVFFPGCQLAAAEPDLVRRVYDDLAARLSGGVGLWLSCCGVMAHWAGEEAAFVAAKEKLQSQWQALGSPVVVAACPTCATTLRDLCGIDTVGIFEVLEEVGLPADALAGGVPKAMVLHHACGARHNAATQTKAAALAGSLGVNLLPADAPAGESPCCGYGGLVPFVNTEVAGKITDVALKQLAPEENAPVLTYCVNCRDRYLAKGRSAWHLLELCYPGEGLRHAPPTWSARQENRAALRQSLLEDVWGETVERMPPMELFLSEELELKMEDTHILHSDIARAIAAAEAEDDKLQSTESGHFITFHRPGNVTFWVEYSPEGGGWRVHNAWCHRMAAIVTDKLSESGAGEA